MPYDENVAAKLEEEFKSAYETNQWHTKVKLANGETVVFHGPDVLVLFPPQESPDAWGNTPVSFYYLSFTRGRRSLEHLVSLTL